MDHDTVLEGAVRLSDWGVIRAAGADSASFLHGQLTQDITGLDERAARLAGYLSPKGRLLASFVVWRPSPDEVLLACSAEVLPAALKRLSMFVLRAKCKLSDATADVPLYGLAGEATLQALGDGQPPAVWSRAGQAIRLPDALIDGRAVPRALWVGDGAPGTALDASTWQWLEVASGVTRIVGATVEQFVPQMVNLELVGGVNFQKGCYPGQEVVARSQYRGTLKRRTYRLGSEVPLQPGQEVFHSEDPGQPAGMVALASSAGGRHEALVELKIATLASGELHLGSADGARLHLLDLPYTFPADNA